MVSMLDILAPRKVQTQSLGPAPMQMPQQFSMQGPMNPAPVAPAAPPVPPAMPAPVPTMPMNPTTGRLGFKEILPYALMALGQGITSNNLGAGAAALPGMIEGVRDRKRQETSRNATYNFLKASGREDLANLYAAGGIDGNTALSQLTKTQEATNLEREFLAAQKHGFQGDMNEFIPFRYGYNKGDDNEPAVRRYEYAVKNGFTGSFVEYLQMEKGKKGIRVRTDADGNQIVETDDAITSGGSKAEEAGAIQSSKNDSNFLNDLRKQALAVDESAAMLEEMKTILDSGYDSGMSAGIRGNFYRGLSDMGIGTDGARKEAVSFEQMRSISKRLAMQSLQLVGGNDTERELAVAIETMPAETKTQEANRKIIDNQLKALSILSERPGFYTRWKQQYGGFDALDEQGRDVVRAWRDFQKEKWGVGKTDPNLAVPSQDKVYKTPTGEFKILGVKDE